MRFRLLVGRHIHGKDKSGKSIVYNAGDVIETNSDLSTLNGKGGMQPKFERLPDEGPVLASVPASIQTDPLDGMSDDELAKLAAEEEIDISGCDDREDIVSTIRASRA